MDDKTYYTLLVSVGLAVVGILAKYVNDLQLARRKDRLDRINAQLRDLYGPLYALDQAGREARDKFRDKWRPKGAYFGDERPTTDVEKEAWRLWMTEVFMPNNLRMEAIIVANAQLVVGGAMPQCFRDLCAHVATYKPVIKLWSQSNFEEHLSAIEYPRDSFPAYVEKTYFELVRQQQRLLGMMDASETGTAAAAELKRETSDEVRSGETVDGREVSPERQEQRSPEGSERRRELASEYPR